TADAPAPDLARQAGRVGSLLLEPLWAALAAAESSALYRARALRGRPRGGPAPLAAAVGHDQVGRDSGEEPDGHERQAERVEAVAADAGPDLADHVEDRPAGERVEAELERIGVHLVTDHRADERGSATHEPGEAEPGPARPHAAERAHDPEALGGVVEGAAGHQHR